MKVKLVSILVAVALIGGLTSAACCPTEVTPSIKVGMLATLSGPYVEGPTQILHGVQLAFSEVNYTVAGRDIELIIEDDSGDPSLTLTKTRKLVEQDEVDVILGPWLSNQALAIRDYINDSQVLWISPMVSTKAMLEEPYYTKYFFRASYINGLQDSAVGAYIAYNEGYRNATCFGMDYVVGHDEVDGFKTVFEGLGGTVIQDIYTPFYTADYGPYMAMIDVENADVIFSYFHGSDAILFVKALDDYGIKDQVPYFFSLATCMEAFLPEQGDSAIGAESTTHYSEALDTPENNRFKQAVWDEYEEQATLYTEHGYVAAKMLILALEEVEGAVEDLDTLIDVLENLEFEAPRGPIRFELHTPVQNIYHTVVEKVDDNYQNTVIDTYPDIGPVWLPEELR